MTVTPSKTLQCTARLFALCTLLGAGGLATGCSGSGRAPTAAVPSTREPVTSVATTPRPSAAAVSTAPVTTTAATALPIEEADDLVQAYLDAWASRGLAAANAQYLATPGAKPGTSTLRLISGHVTSSNVFCVGNPRVFVLIVSLDLHFPGGDGGAWGEGANTRFVTFTRNNATEPFRLSLSTGPVLCQ